MLYLGVFSSEKASERWEQFCLMGILHAGDNDSTGAIGGAWFESLYGFNGVNEKIIDKLKITLN